MSNYSSLKATINANIKQNGNEEITGPILNSVLNAMVDSLAGYHYSGIATPATNPGTPDSNVFYIAYEAGTYTNFGGLAVAEGEVAILKYNGTWTKEVTGAATAAELSQLAQKINTIIGSGLLYGTYTMGVIDGKYCDKNGTLRAATGTSCTKIFVNQNSCGVRFEISQSLGTVNSIIGFRGSENPVAIYAGPSSVNNYDIDLSGFDFVYLNFYGSRVSSYIFYNNEKLAFEVEAISACKGAPIDLIGTKRGYFNIVNNAIIVNDLFNYSYDVYDRSVFDKLGANEILVDFGPTDRSSFPGIIQTDSSDNIIASTKAISGKYVVKILDDTAKIYVNYFNAVFGGVNISYNIAPSSQLRGLVNELVVPYDTGNLVGYVGTNGVVVSTPTFKYIKLSGKYIKAISFNYIRSATPPIVVTEKDGQIDFFGFGSFFGEKYINLNCECEWIYVNFFDGTYINDVKIYKDFQHIYQPSFKFANVLNRPYVFNGKTAWFFGDSITAGYSTVNGQLTVLTNGYPKQFSDSVGMSFQNKGVGGEMIYLNSGDNYTLNHVQQAGTLTPDYIFIAAGSNDYDAQNSLTDFETAVQTLFTYLQNNFSGEVIIILPINRIDRRYTINFVTPLNAYREILMREAIKYKYSIVDGSSFAFPNIKDGLYSYLLSDEAHPTENGYSYYAKMLRTILC